MKLLVVKSQNFEAWSTPASNGKGKDADTYWLSVQFKKDDNPDTDKCWIDVKDCFFSCYAHKDGTLSPKLVVMNYDYSETPTQATTTKIHRR